MKPSRSLEFLAREYARSRKKPGYVSVGRAARAITTLSPDNVSSRRELDNIIARCALAEGCAVVFDGALDI